MYLREMGTVPLLTREGEVAIAKRIERGQLLVLKTISRSPIVLKELLAVGEDLRNGARSIKEIVQFDEEELTEEKIESKTARDAEDHRQDREALCAWRSSRPRKLESMPQSKKRAYLRARIALARTRVEMSLLRPLDRIQLAETQAPDRPDAPHGRARCSRSSAKSASWSAARTPPRANVPPKRARNCAHAARELQRNRRRQRSRAPPN